MHNYAYDFHEHNPRRKPNPKDAVNCVSCRGTGLVHGARELQLGGRVIPCTRCGGHGLLLKPSPKSEEPTEIVEGDHQDPLRLSPADHERLVEAAEEIVTEAEREAEQERVARLREQMEERERRAARERVEEQERLEQERIERLRKARLQAEADEGLWDEVGKKAVRKGRVGRALRGRLTAMALVVVFGGIVAALVTETTFDDINVSVTQWWGEFGIGDVGGASQPPNSEGPTSLVVPVAPSPTATSTATPNPTPAPTATAVAISPWVGFAISRETLGREMLDRLSDEEIACIRSTNSEAFYEYLEALPLGVRILTNPPVHDVSDLPQLSDCLTAESTMHLNLAIAQFHDPTAPTPIPTSAPIQTPTPEPAPAATPTPLPTPTVEPTQTPRPSPPPGQESTH